jgi:hypothetical protein
MPARPWCFAGRIAVVIAFASVLSVSTSTASAAATSVDLNVWPFTVDSSTVTAGGTVTARVSVTNGGPAPAASVTLSFYIGPADSAFTIATTAHLKTVQLGTLSARRSTSVTTAVPVPSTWKPGTYRIKAEARSSTPDQSISNNVKLVSIAVKASATTTTSGSTSSTSTVADLNVSAFAVDTYTVPPGGTVTARVSLNNSGPLSADLLKLSFYIGPADSAFTIATTAHLKTVQLGTLSARSSTSVTTAVPVPSTWKPGTYRIKAEARSSTPDQSIINNVKLVSIAVKASATTTTSGSTSSTSTVADLNVSAFAVDKYTVPPGGTMTARVSLNNSGPFSADLLKLSFYIGPADSAFTIATTAHLKTVELGTLPAGASTSLAATVAVPSAWSPGVYRLKAVVRSSIPDDNLSNNEKLVSTEVASSTTIANGSLDSSSPTFSSSSVEKTPTTAVTLPLKYKKYLDGLLAANLATWSNRQETSVGYSLQGRWDLYQSETIIMGALSMFETMQTLAANDLGSLDTTYLDIALTWIESWTNRPLYVPLTGSPTAQQIADASKTKFIIDSQGNKNWSGGIDGWDLAGTGITAPARVAYELGEVQGMVQMARAVRIIKTNAALNATYGARATAVGNLVQHMVTKWMVHRGLETSAFTAYINNGSGSMSDRPLQWLAIFVNMHRAGYGEFRPGRTYQNLAAQWLSLILANKVSSPDFRATCSGAGCPAPSQSILAGEASILGFNTINFPFECGPDPVPCSWDTGHYSRWPKLLVYAYDAGTVVQLPHILKTANLFTRIIWDGSTTFPRFRNRTDGRNSLYRNVRDPWENGAIYNGFASLGRFDSTALTAAEATMDCIIANCGSPSLAFYSGDDGRFNLAAEVTLARLRFELGQ